MDEQVDENNLMENTTERHLMAVEISIELLIQIMTTGWESGMVDSCGYFSRIRCERGLPEGTKFSISYYEPKIRGMIIVCEHPSFPVVKLGDEFPRLSILMTEDRVKLINFQGIELERGSR